MFPLLTLTGIGIKEEFSASLLSSEKFTTPLLAVYLKRKITEFKYPHFQTFLPSGLLFSHIHVKFPHQKWILEGTVYNL